MPSKLALENKECCFEGHVLSEGIAIGIPYDVRTFSFIPHEDLSSPQAVEDEVARYRNALRQSQEYLIALRNQALAEGGQEVILLLEAHLGILADPLLNEEVERDIRLLAKNAEFVVQQTVERFEKRFRIMSDLFFQQRIDDIHDISQRILDCLQNKRRPLAKIPPHSVILAHTINPSDAMEARHKAVAAFVAESGSTLSHAAIIAKARGIPFIATTHFLEIIARISSTPLVVDGLAGKVIVHPTQETLQHYVQRQEELRGQHDAFKKSLALPSQTQEGDPITLYVSVDSIEECAQLKESNAQGVGLFRTEYLVLERGAFPSEEEQFFCYKTLVEHMGERPVIIRTFDLSLDKVLAHVPSLSQEQLITQLRAIVRASHYGQVQLLFPMISSLDELIHVKKLLQQVQRELNHDQPISVGCMVEVPTAAMMCDLLVKECDFLSIGTNDLMQYILAIDRLNQSSHIGKASTHAGFLRLLQLIIEEGERGGVPVYICGEMAGDPRLTPLLVGLGATRFSVPLRLLPLITHVVRLTSKQQSMQLAKEVLDAIAPRTV